MTALTMTYPLPVQLEAGASSAGDGLANLLTPNPKEAFVASAAGATIALDLGGDQIVDTFFLGYTNLPAGTMVAVAAGANGGQPVGQAPVAHSYRRAPLRHAIVQIDAPIVARYIRFTIAAGPPPLIAGVVAIGAAVRAFGYEFGGGRPISDTSRVDRLLGGGFGIQRGATAGGFQWTMPDLTDEQCDRLYALQLDAGTAGTVLVTEERNVAAGANEAMHWSLLTKLEPYGRQAPDENKWSMQVQDWA